MLDKTSFLNLTSAMASHAAQRHAVITDNIANADTPGFKAKDIESFSDVFKSAQASGAQLSAQKYNIHDSHSGDASSPNGNTVSLEDQMVKSSQAQIDHDLALMLYKKSLNMMKMAVGKNL